MGSSNFDNPFEYTNHYPLPFTLPGNNITMFFTPARLPFLYA